MLSVRDIHGWRLQTTDGGSPAALSALYIDDKEWSVKYAGARRHARAEVLVPALLIGAPDFKEKSFPLRLSGPDLQDRVRVPAGPTLVLGVKERKEHSWMRYVSDLRSTARPPRDCSYPPPQLHADLKARHGSKRLRSSTTLIGYRMIAADGTEGRLHDMLVDLGQWYIPYVVMELGRGRHWRRLLLRPQVVDRIETQTRRIFVAGDRAVLEAAPSLDWERSSLTH